MSNDWFKRIVKRGTWGDDESLQELINPLNVSKLAVALTHFIYRNGPIEDMHTDGKLSNDDMAMLNKYMVNRLSVVIELLQEKDFQKLELGLAGYANLYGRNWDDAVKDPEAIDDLIAAAKLLTHMTFVD